MPKSSVVLGSDMKEVSKYRCNNPECCASTGICGKTTYGTGELDQNGYWEYPCNICSFIDFLEYADEFIEELQERDFDHGQE
jgi:hypothetical protein